MAAGVGLPVRQFTASRLRHVRGRGLPEVSRWTEACGLLEESQCPRYQLLKTSSSIYFSLAGQNIADKHGETSGYKYVFFIFRKENIFVGQNLYAPF